ncbi:hypothetical protein ATK17_1229 [Branchiibius hedensis]|uniref:O-antigen ligase n=1 Tax=Branchiibius hedensis TaxID=672460 RepID=A0A2Y9BTE8_9MICO|nr:O-antigen ligase family protein [Branchiibius hedensis]PWJ25117.1 hypothetical protein ATK17_1229 [Branchiibius hedensis]SSA33932.1 hypothetical protein SAMN04489750_1229 [Branchiibius hedensis]
MSSSALALTRGSTGRHLPPPTQERLTWTLRIVVPAFVLCVYYLDVLRIVGVPPRLVITALLLAVLLTGIGPHGPLTSIPGAGYLTALFLVGAGFALSSLISGSVVASSNGQRFLMTFPIAVAAGWVLACSRAGLDYLARTIATVGTLTAVLAIIEFATGHSLFRRDAEFETYVRGDSARAVVGAEHPLILGVLLCVAVPFTYRAVRRWWLRWSCLAVLLAGVYVTGSRGPWGVSIGVVVLLAVPGLARFIGRHFGTLLFAVMVGLGVLWYFASRVWQPVTTSTDTLANSMEYRAAIYSLLPRILLAQPFGYGLGDLPTGVWLIRGPSEMTDITATVDSQWVLSAMRLGWLGVALVFLLVAIAIVALRRRLDFGLGLFVFTGCGTFVALDAWDGAGSLWMVLVGVCVRLMSYAPHSIEAGITDNSAESAALPHPPGTVAIGSGGPDRPPHRRLRNQEK